MFKQLIISMRPKQWIKNGFVFAGLLFSKSFFKLEPTLKTLACFVLFSMVSGTVYILNDIIDKEKDAHHPEKCKRPIASDKLSRKTALAFHFIILTVSLVAAAFIDLRMSLFLIGYYFLVLAYSLKLKNIFILDVIVLSMGFVLRTVAGAVIIDVWISPWLVLCTMLLAQFLSFNKRKNELMVLSEKAGEHKKTLEYYTPELINSMISVISAVMLMTYSLYTFSAGKSSYMMITIPFVFYGIFRYQYLVINKNEGGNPETTFLKDKPLLIDVFLWVVLCAIIVAFFQ